MSLPRLPLVALVLVLASGCSVDDTPAPVAAAPSPPAAGGSPIPLASPSRGAEAQDPCTQLALTRLDGLLMGEPSAAPERSVRANEVVAEFVKQYEQVLVASGPDAARAAVAGKVGEACKLGAGEGNVVEVPVEQAPASPAG